MTPRHLIAAVDADHQDWLLRERDRKRRQQLERRVVGPMEVVQQDRRRTAPRNRLECTTDRLEQGGTVAVLGPRPEFRKDHRQVCAERTAVA